MRIDLQSFSPKDAAGFIVVDGVNGAGKSTLLEGISKYLESVGQKFIRTREPGGTKIGAALRALVLENKAGAPSPLTEIFLFAADRAQHVSEVIKPALKDKKLVLSDRYFYSTIAFQGYGRGLPIPEIQEINRIAVDGAIPDLVIILDLSPEDGLKRNKKRVQEGGDRFEAEELAFHERLRAGFLDMAEKRKEAFLVIDATQSPEAILKCVLPFIEKLIKSAR